MKIEKIIFASDFKGIALRKKLFKYAKHLNVTIEDIGIKEGSPLDFVDVTKLLAQKLSFPNVFGILICNDGHGVAIAANRYPFIRAVRGSCEKDVEAIRNKLDANVLCLGCKNTSLEQAKSCLDVFINTPFKLNKYGNSVEKLATAATLHVDTGINLIVRGVIVYNNHILLSKPTQLNTEFANGFYFLPGGHVEYNESAITALKREIYEEMKLQVKKSIFMGALECSWNKKGEIYHELNLVYYVEIPQLSLSVPPMSSEPFIEFIWCPLSDLSNYYILPEKFTSLLQEMDIPEKKSFFYSQMLKLPD